MKKFDNFCYICMYNRHFMTRIRLRFQKLLGSCSIFRSIDCNTFTKFWHHAMFIIKMSF